VQEFFGEPMRDPVELVPYDPAWPERFQGFRERIVDVLGAGVRTDHVGSTSMRGLLAKPMIDIQMALADLEKEADYWPGLESLGWQLRGRSPSAGSSARRRDSSASSTLSKPPRTMSSTTCCSGTSCACMHAAVRDTYA
jgi:GrpB-like predicted nucleotidyltransferase (UPF0157 family)